jgi:hypothetical protein
MKRNYLYAIGVAIIIIGGLLFYKFSAQPKALVSPGDKLGAMTVVHVGIAINPKDSGTNNPELMNIGPNNIRVLLKGPIDVTGTYKQVHSGIGFDGDCMTNFDAASLARLPSLPGESYAPQGMFCFRNTDFVEKNLGTKSHLVTVKIDNYELVSYPSEVMDYADLVAVGNK